MQTGRRPAWADHHVADRIQRSKPPGRHGLVDTVEIPEADVPDVGVHEHVPVGPTR